MLYNSCLSDVTCYIDRKKKPRGNGGKRSGPLVRYTGSGHLFHGCLSCGIVGMSTLQNWLIQLMIGVSYHLKIIQSFANNNIKKTCETS